MLKYFTTAVTHIHSTKELTKDLGTKTVSSILPDGVLKLYCSLK
jgi:hypothetical protein